MRFNNYPIVQGLRLVLWFAAASTLVIGISQISRSPGVQVGAAIMGSWAVVSIYLPYALAAVVMALLAEVSGVLVRISENLDEVRETNRRLLVVTEDIANAPPSATPVVTPTVAPSALSPNAKGHPFQATLEGRPLGNTAPVYALPSTQSRYLGVSRGGRAIALYGRDSFGLWVCGDLAGTKWVQVTDLTITGDVMSLPVITPPSSG